MADAAGAGIGAFDAYVTVDNDSGIPPAVSSATHARQQANMLTADLDRQEAKATAQREEISARLVVLRADLARANLVAASESDYPQIAAVVAEIVKREAKAAARADEVEARIVAAREAAAAAEDEAQRLEAEAPATEEH